VAAGKAVKSGRLRCVGVGPAARAQTRRGFVLSRASDLEVKKNCRNLPGPNS
jgi:hypothetical protein